jgi:integral membrane protein
MTEKPRITRLFHWIGLVEGTTLLALVLIGMPLKYWLQIPGPNWVIGMAHGIAAMAFVLMLIVEAVRLKPSIFWVLLAFITSFIPGGTFWFFARRTTT